MTVRAELRCAGAASPGASADLGAARTAAGETVAEYVARVTSASGRDRADAADDAALIAANRRAGIPPPAPTFPARMRELANEPGTPAAPGTPAPRQPVHQAANVGNPNAPSAPRFAVKMRDLLDGQPSAVSVLLGRGR